MSSVFLHGGGDDPAWRAATFGRFAQATRAQPAQPIALVVAEPDLTERAATAVAYRAIFAELGISDTGVVTLSVSPEQPLSAAMLAQHTPSGVFVCGGTTPYYHGAVCSDTAWTTYLRDTGLPYCGTSAGAAVAARQAIVGGWQAHRSGQDRAVVFVGAGEGLTAVTVQSGLALVPFAVDVHASQWGTLLRLIHAVDLELVAEGWALDEDTLLEVAGASMGLYGKGHAYHVRRMAGGVGVTIYTASSELPTAN